MAEPIQSKSYRSDLSKEKLHALKFQEHPFLTSADPRFLYLSKQHLSVLDRVEDAINYREGLAVIEGRIGVGKTTIARRLYDMHYDDDSCKIVYIHTATYSTDKEAASDIARAFGLPINRALIVQLRNFEEYLVKIRKEDKNTIVIIDDAQKMSTKSLDAIQSFLNFDISVKLIQIILFGQPEIHEPFSQNEAVLDRVSSWQRLTPLPADDALNMIQFRINVAGRQDPLMTDGGFLKLYEYTEGVPRSIILVCNEILHILARQAAKIADIPEVLEAIQNVQTRKTFIKENE
jgi:type II secretory pathway predicted ATPase ExeA